MITRHVLFRTKDSDRDPRFPLLPEVSVDGGQTWHEIPCYAMSVHEAVDEPCRMDLGVFVLPRNAENPA